MTLAEALRATIQTFTQAAIPHAGEDAAALIQHVTNLTKLEMILEETRELTPQEHEHLNELIAKRLERVPLAYILGFTDFWGYRFKIRPGVLVPRPDSETLLAILQTLITDKTQAFSVADIGVGSGCLILSILKDYPHAQGYGIDCESIPLSLTADNATILNVADRLTLINGQGAAPLPECVDVLISNPPYIAEDEWADLAPEVTTHEPQTALLAGKDGLAIYRQLIPQAYEKLKTGGILLLEIGYQQQNAVTGLLEQQKFVNVQCLKDLSGNDRVMLALKPSS